jgi:hypothetical protein
VRKLRAAWGWLKANWKAAFAGPYVLLVLVYTALSKRHRKQAVELKRQAHIAEGGKVERIKDAAVARGKAEEHGDKANRHQDKARKVIERLEGKSKAGRMGAAEAEELAKRIAGEE